LREAGFPRAVRPLVQEIAEMVHEARPVAHALADRPPVPGVRVGLVLDADAAHAVELAAILPVAVQQLVETRVLEHESAAIAVDLQRDVPGPAHAAARHLEHTASA